MNNQQIMGARAARMRRINKFYDNNSTLRMWLEQYSDYKQKDLEEELDYYKSKRKSVLFIIILFCTVGAFVLFSSIALIVTEKASELLLLIFLSVGVIIIFIPIFFQYRYFEYNNKISFLSKLIESFKEPKNYDLNDISQLKSFRLSKFLYTPRTISEKYDFISGVYAVHCLHKPYEKEYRIPLFITAGIGFRYDAKLVAEKIKSDWKLYKKGGYDGPYEYIYDHLYKYNISFRQLRITFLESIVDDLDEAIDEWCDFLKLGDSSWMG